MGKLGAELAKHILGELSCKPAAVTTPALAGRSVTAVPNGDENLGGNLGVAVRKSIALEVLVLDDLLPSVVVGLNGQL